MSGEVLRRGSNRNGTFENLKPHVGPFTNGFERDASVDKSLGKVSATSSESIGANGHWSWNFVGFEERDSLRASKVRRILGSKFE